MLHPCRNLVSTRICWDCAATVTIASLAATPLTAPAGLCVGCLRSDLHLMAVTIAPQRREAL
jgi:hypothetical protein